MSEDAIHLHQKNRAKSLLKRVPRVKTFLNRLLGLPTPTQTLLYDLFEARFSAEKRQQARAGLTSGLERGMKESKREVCELLREVEIRSDDKYVLCCVVQMFSMCFSYTVNWPNVFPCLLLSSCSAAVPRAMWC